MAKALFKAIGFVFGLWAASAAAQTGCPNPHVLPFHDHCIVHAPELNSAFNDRALRDLGNVAEGLMPNGLIRIGTNAGFGLFAVARPVTSITDAVDVYVTRDANFVGGSSANVNAAMVVGTTVRAGAEAYEWNALFQMDNYTTQPNGGQNTALYATGTKRSTGNTWAGTFQLTDYNTAAPSYPGFALEIDMTVNGPDPSANRTMVQLYTNKSPGGASPPTIQYGLHFDGDASIYNYGIAFDGAGSNYFWNLIATRAGMRYYYGIELTDSFCDGANFKSANFLVGCAGDVNISESQPLNITATGVNQGYLRLIPAGAGNYIESGVNGTPGSVAPIYFTELGAGSMYAALSNNGMSIGGAPSGGLMGQGTINVENAYYINGTIGAVCVGGTVNAATMVVVRGIVTHC